jgi:hypothetical protein
VHPDNRPRQLSRYTPPRAAIVMTPKKPPPAGASSSNLPYPLTPEERLQSQHLQHADSNTNGPPYSPSLLDSPAFDLRDLSDALESQTQQRSNNTMSSPASKVVEREELPDLLKVGHDRTSGETLRGSGGTDVKRSSTEMRRSYERGEIPEALQPGASPKSTELRRPAELPAQTPDSDICKLSLFLRPVCATCIAW